MGAPALLVLPDPAQKQSSLAGSIFSPSESASSSLSLTDSASSSFTQSLPPDGDPAPKILKKEEKLHHRKKKNLLDFNFRQKNNAKLKQVKKSTSIEPLRDSNTALTSCSTKGSSTKGSTCKACCRCAGAFAADCAALCCCCPCAILSFLAFFLVELPSTAARKLVTHLQTRLCIKDATSARSSRGGDTIFTPTWSYREPSEGEREKQIIRFDTQNLLKHFEAEHVGFGCLSQKRE